mgnify:CR=1 FL=1
MFLWWTMLRFTKRKMAIDTKRRLTKFATIKIFKF